MASASYPTNRTFDGKGYFSHAAQHVTDFRHLRLIRYIISYRLRNHACRPGQEAIALHLGVSVPTIKRWTRDLEAVGLLAVERHDPYPDTQNGGRWTRLSNRYRLCWCPKGASPQVAPRDHERSVSHLMTTYGRRSPKRLAASRQSPTVESAAHAVSLDVYVRRTFNYVDAMEAVGRRCTVTVRDTSPETLPIL